MWVLVLDRSSSMGRPFGGRTTFSGRNRKSNAQSKLDAATQSVVEHLAGLGAAARVVLIAFNNTPELIYDGPSDDAAAVRAALDAVTAEGGTNLALALNRAAATVRGAMLERLYRVLVITDGETDADTSRVAAEELARAGAIIDVTLIDPTDDGEAVARAIAIDGTVSAVSSASELQREVGRAKEAQEAQRESAEALVARQDQERAQLFAEKPRDERLAFTALYPPEIESARWYPFTVYIHLAALREEVERQIRLQAGATAGTPFISVAHATRGVARGTWLTLTPRVSGLEFNPATATVAWHEDIQDVRFRFRAIDGSADQSAFGQLDVAVGPLPVAHLGVVINVHAGASTSPGVKPEPQQASVYQDVFASYSSMDSAIIQAFRETYWGLGIQLVVDKRTLRSGDSWDPALRALIERCDLFQLFWSKNASQSNPVRQEYLHALAQVPKKNPGFIRPLTWEDPPPSAPAELARIHFTPIDLGQLAKLSGKPVDIEVSAAIAAQPHGRSGFLPGTAVPLVPGASPETVLRVREDLGIAVRFLEETTGLRYYPVPTLLVDEHLVKAVRVEETVDLEPADPMPTRRALDMLAFLRAICVQLHVGGFTPEKNDRRAFQRRFAPEQVMSITQFEWLRTRCEVFPHLDDVLMPEWRVALRSLGESIGRPQLDLSLTEFVTLFLEKASDEVAKNPAGKLTAKQQPYAVGSIHVSDDLMQVFSGAGGVRQSQRPLSLVGPPAAFAALLRALSANLAELLVPVQAVDNSKVVAFGDATDLRARCTLASFLANELLSDGHDLLVHFRSFQLDRWVEQILSPHWMHIGRELKEHGLASAGSLAGVREVLEIFLGVVQRLLDAGKREGDFDYEMSFPLSAATWTRLSAEIGDCGLRVRIPSWSSNDDIVLAGRLFDFIECFRMTTQRVLGLLASPLHRRSGKQQLFTEVSPTFGIFAPSRSAATDLALHRWATDMGVAQAITLPGADRVLFCLAARDRFEKGLRESLSDSSQVRYLAAAFQRAVLVHEHFHAALEVGIDSNGGTAVGARSGKEWGDTRNLNESLAAWMELHFARGDAALEALVWDYIRAGSYPAWPYAGAESIERQYAAGGLGEVRRWIGKLRQTPQQAQQEFDSMRR